MSHAGAQELRECRVLTLPHPEEGSAIDLASGYEPEVGPAVRAIFEEEGVKVISSAIAKAVRKDGEGVVVTYQTGGETRELRAEHSRQSRRER